MNLVFAKVELDLGFLWTAIPQIHIFTCWSYWLSL